MPTLPYITIDTNEKTFVVDGKEFPYYLTEDGPKFEIVDEIYPTVTITLLAEDVTVDGTSYSIDELIVAQRNRRYAEEDAVTDDGTQSQD